LRRAANSRRHPRAAKAAAQARPMPLDAPVTKTHRFVKSMLIFVAPSHDRDEGPFYLRPRS
jgi:hypothetical protein